MKFDLFGIVCGVGCLIAAGVIGGGRGSLYFGVLGAAAIAIASISMLRRRQRFGSKR